MQNNLLKICLFSALLTGCTKGYNSAVVQNDVAPVITSGQYSGGVILLSGQGLNAISSINLSQSGSTIPTTIAARSVTSLALNVVAGAVLRASLPVSLVFSSPAGASTAVLTVNLSGTQITNFSSTGISDLATSTLLTLTGGRVGIGLTTPNRLLDLYGAANPTPLRLLNGATAVSSEVAIEFALQNSAFSPVDFGVISGGITTNTGGAEDGFLKFSTVSAGTLREAVRIDSVGKLGVGTPAPATKLHVYQNTAADLITRVENANSGYGSYLETSANSLFSSVRAYSSVSGSEADWRFGLFGSRSFSIFDSINFTYPFAIELNTPSNTLYVSSLGRIGVGTANPGTTLQVAGIISPAADNSYSLGTGVLRFTNVYATSGVVSTSDRRLKTDIRDSDLGLPFITKLKPVSYRWNSGADHDEHYGFIAQDLERSLFQERGPSPIGIVTHDSDSDRYGLRYSELLAPLVRAVQELFGMLSGMKAENERLAAGNAENQLRIQSLERQLDSLRSYLCAKDAAGCPAKNPAP